MSLVTELRRMGLLAAAPEAEAPTDLLRLCHQGALVGGLSAALDLRPDELWGPLLSAVGGSASRLRVLDVRDRPEPELVVAHEGATERWALPEGVRSLVHNLNDLLRADPHAKAIAVLGEWEDMLQLWCVGKGALPQLLCRPFFAPENLADLEAMR